MDDMPMNAEVYAAALAYVRARRATYGLLQRARPTTPPSVVVDAMMQENAAAEALDEIVGRRVFDAGYITPLGRLP